MAGDWMDDKREIKALMLGSGESFHTNCGDTFARIEQPGEMAMVPWVRISTLYHDGIQGGYRRTVEARLGSLHWIEYAQ